VRPRIGPFAAAAVLLVGACSTDDDAAGEVDATASAGCDQDEGDIAGGPRTLDHAGLERAYAVHLPDAYDGETPAPMLFNLHGFGEDIESQDAATDLPAEAGARGYVVVTPQGAPLSVPEDTPQADDAAGFEGFAFWNFFGSAGIDFGGQPPPGLENVQPEDLGTDDVGFFAALMDTLLDEYCLDADRIFSTGMSNGAGMSTTLACELGERLRAIAPVAGVNLTGACAGDEPVPVRAIHGDADSTASYGGNTLFDFELGNPSVPDRMTAWADHNGCDSRPTVDDSVEGVVLTRWDGCDDDGVVELWTLTGWEHQWPRGPDAEPPAPIDATDVVLDFFDDVGAR